MNWRFQEKNEISLFQINVFAKIGSIIGLFEKDFKNV